MKLQNMTSCEVKGNLKTLFSQHGIPETCMSDNAKQFTSIEFKEFAEWNFKQVTRSPHFPQANGEAERAVRTSKDILRQQDTQLALLVYRATPIPFLLFLLSPG